MALTKKGLLRLIIIRNNKTLKEEVLFTEDKVALGTQWCVGDDYVAYDKEVENNLPSEFPTEYVLRVIK